MVIHKKQSNGCFVSVVINSVVNIDFLYHLRQYVKNEKTITNTTSSLKDDKMVLTKDIYSLTFLFLNK